MRLELVPIRIRDAREFVARHHRHHRHSVGAIFAVAVARDHMLEGVALVGRPVARGLQDGFTAEVLRLATLGASNACSMLYRAAWRACRAMGYRRLVTYTLASEPGASLRGAGFREVGRVRPRSWSCPSRPRIDRVPLQEKIRWQLDEAPTETERT